MVAQSVASATFQVTCAGYAGSGFTFLRPDVLVTSFHIIRGGYQQPKGIVAKAEDGREFAVEYLTHSPDTAHDFAVLRLKGSVNGGAGLRPRAGNGLPRGLDVLLSGYPHGVNNLLVHRAIVSGPCEDKGFFIDSAVNGGHAGGPIVDAQTGEVVGILTARRVLGLQDLDQMATEASKLAKSFQQVATQGAVAIMGVDFGPFAKMVAQSNILIRRVIEANANAGIGVGYHIAPVMEACAKLGLN